MKIAPLALVRNASASQPPKITATQDPHGAVTIRVEAATIAAPDELVAFPFGLERAAASAVVRSGRLPAARIGRRLYAKRSDILALVDNAPRSAEPAPEPDDYAAAVSRTRRRA